ncbi:hypothetical protein [Rhodoferax sp. GW822-FHT02A01]|uniref:RipA family octameric membrane protein n=1 Tax=Rhodoferax sp. GW822-FHT02A01 TaxID=3141537 RepID=UPI00315D5E2D
MNSKEYLEAFGIDPPNPELLAKALEHARDNRKFEIELYWKRATYFWTLIAAAFVGYFAVSTSSPDSPEKRFLAFALACIGFVFTFAWFQVNRGSKQWQENWENHVDMLENPVTGPLYKTVLRRPTGGDGFFERNVTGPSAVSVSKVNQIVNLFTLFVWAQLSLYIAWPLSPSLPLSWPHLIAISTTLVFCVLIGYWSTTYLGDHVHYARLRQTQVAD